jgi:hypothetical protein
MQTHLSCQVREDDFTARKLHTKEGIGKRLVNDTFGHLWFPHICAS